MCFRYRKRPATSASAASVDPVEGGQSLSDVLVLLQHLGDVPKNSKPGLSETGNTFPGKERSSIKSFVVWFMGTDGTVHVCQYDG